MMLSAFYTYLDVLMKHSYELMWEADEWPEIAQEHLRSVWTHVDVMVAIMPLPQLPILELCHHIKALGSELDRLENFQISENAIWHLQVLRNGLEYLSQVIDEQRCDCLTQSAVSDAAH